VKRPDKVKNILGIISKAVGLGRLTYSHHANVRMKEREIIKPEVVRVLTSGHHEAKKDQFREDFNSWDYAIKGKTVDGRNLRIVVAFESPNVLVVTAIDLDKED
jgi:DUF917 family protein